MSCVFLASQYGRRLPSDPASRRRPCLGLVVILMYLVTHEGEPPTGDLHPHTHAHAGRTTIASRPTAARQRFLLNLKRFVWAAAAEAKR